MANIAFDVDGVLTNLEKFQIENGKKYFKDIKTIDDTKYDVKEIFNCTKEQREKFWLKYIWSYCLTEEMTPYASELSKKLKKDGNKIYIITGRVHTTEEGTRGKLFRKMLLYWLKKNNFVYDEIVYVDEKNSSNEKLDACKNNNIDLIIEDKAENIEAIKGTSDIVCINAGYNRNYDFGNNIPRLNDLKDAYNTINEMLEKNNKKFKKLTEDEREKLSKEDLIKYYENLRDYYRNIPFEDKDLKKQERNYVISNKIGMPVFNMIFKPNIICKDKVPKDNESYIFVSNHLGSLDQFPIISSIGNDRPIHFLTSSTLLGLKRAILYKATGSIFIDREDPESRLKSKEKMNQILINGGNIFLFPEGTRNRTDKYMLDFKLGAVSMARTTGKKIIPFAVNNNYFNKDPLIVRVGDPIEVKETDNLVEKNEELRNQIATMIWNNMEVEKELTLKKDKK